MKVLIFGMTENPGGVESFLMNYYRCINKEKIQFDFLCNTYQPIAYENEIHQLGGRIYHITARRKNYLRYMKELRLFFEQHGEEYRAIWVNLNNLSNIDYLKMAKKYGISKRIIHSHNSSNMDGKLRVIPHNYNKRRIGKYATDFWACSLGASEWFYGSDHAMIIQNAINIEEFSFSEDKRRAYQTQLGWENNFIIGNIGRFHFQKNQLFILDVFNSLLHKMPEARLVLIGQGNDEGKIKEKIQDLNLEGKVYMPGIQQDIGGWFSAMDLFLFPSVFEGLSVVALEAQANGIPILASNSAMVQEAKINRNVVCLDLNRPVEEWTQMLYKMAKEYSRETNDKLIKADFRKKHFDIKREVQKLELFFER